MTDTPSTGELTLPQRASLADVRPDAVLRFCEAVHFTGTLSFTTGVGKGLLPVLNGVPEVSGDATMEAALDEFFALTEGEYTLHQMLPTLEGSTRDGDLSLHGKLTVGVIPELMRYCESAGITGTLHLNRAEQRCDIRYERGDLSTITIDREEDADLARVFAWPDGSFVIESRPVFDTGPRVTTPEPQLLKTLEVALAEIMDQRQRRSEVPASPFRAPSIRALDGIAFGVEHAPGVAPQPRPMSLQPPPRRTVSPPPQTPDSTVKVLFVARNALPESSGTRHAAAHLGREELRLDPSSRALRPLTEETAAKHIAAVSKSQPPEPAAARPEPAKAPAPRAAHWSPWSAAFGAVATIATLSAVWVLYSLLH